MASPQLEDGYTRIANELLAALTLYPFSKRQLKVMLAIIRRTYGFGKKEDDVTVTRISEDTGLTRPHTSATITELELLGAVLKRDGRYGYVLGINKNYADWGRPKTGHVPNQDVPKQDMSRNGTTPVPKQDTPRPETGHTKEISQKTILKRKAPPLPEWLKPETWEAYVEHRKHKRAALTDNAIRLTFDKLAVLRTEGQDPNRVLERSIMNGWTGVFPLKDDDQGMQPQRRTRKVLA